jgi:hypothetical protein
MVIQSGYLHEDRDLILFSQALRNYNGSFSEFTFEENTLIEITVGKEQASDTDESKKMLHLEQNSVENDRGSNNPGRPVIFKVGRYCIAIIVFGSGKMYYDLFVFVVCKM